AIPPPTMTTSNTLSFKCLGSHFSVRVQVRFWLRGSVSNSETRTPNREHSTELEHDLRTENREVRTTSSLISEVASTQCGRNARASARVQRASRGGCRARG